MSRNVPVVITLAALLLWSSGLAAQAADDAVAPARLSGHEFDFERTNGIVYAEHSGTALQLDLYVPACDGPHPTALVIHGGGWIGGNRALLDAAALSRALVQEGLAVASISYRLAPRFDHPAQIDDCRSAVQYLRAHAAELHLDATRLAVVGASAGGHLAGLLATMDDGADPKSADVCARQSTRATCAVAICAPFDLLPVPGRAGSTLQIRLVSELLGLDEVDDVPRKIELLNARGRDASPLYRVSRDDAPMLLVDGARDAIVEPYQAERMLAALRASDVPCAHFRLPAGGHCEFLLGPAREWCAEPPPFWTAIRAFLRARLLGAPAR